MSDKNIGFSGKAKKRESHLQSRKQDFEWGVVAKDFIAREARRFFKTEGGALTIFHGALRWDMALGWGALSVPHFFSLA